MGALIQSIQIDGQAGVDFSSIDQWRIGGFTQPTNGVPDGGTTLMLLSTSLAGLGIARRFIKRQTPL
jgi:VPDSG-CTERM motif